MNLKELAFPIRLYWDLTPVPDADTIDYPGICEQIIEAKFFTLDLLDTGASLSNECLTILERLRDETIVIALTVSRNAFTPHVMSSLSDLNVRGVLVDTTAKKDLSFIADVAAQHNKESMTTGASFRVTKDNYEDIPAVVSSCLDHGITRLVFPMQRLTGKNECFYISGTEGKRLSKELTKTNFDTMKITIHDPFLWRIFYPAVSFPGGGCQAANSMASIAPDGKVYPCPSMPVELGDLHKTPLKAILSSAYKKELVTRLHQPPDECSGCEELSGCMGGCSGRVYELTGSLDLRDPACK